MLLVGPGPRTEHFSYSYQCCNHERENEMNEILELVFKSPVANLLIIAGLVVLGIAVVDNVSGKIQPVTAGRLLSDLLGL